MKKLTKWFKWIDDNILKVLIGAYIFLIPLYPKLPIRMVTYTYIAVRFEDLFMAVIVFVFFLQLLRKKITLNERFIRLFLLFWLAVFISFLFNRYVTEILPYKMLALLHSLRRIEYMIIFFIAGSVVKTKKDFFIFLSLSFVVFFIVTVYGIGQKFLGWPAVQTMNPEYAKGYILFLTPEARISSTFAGHYDLAAYLVFFMPIIIGFFLYKKNAIYFVLFLLGLFDLVLTASRASYAAYLVSIIIFLSLFKKWKTLLAVIFFTVLFTASSKSLTSRLTRTFQVKQIFVNQQTGQVVVPQNITTKEVPAGTMYVQLNSSQIQSGLDQTKVANKELMIKNVRERIREDAKKRGQILSAEEENMMIASITAGLKPISSLVPDISFATRLQVEWPRAIMAFLKNPILGTGPSSITEATDNDYLRALGEFGLLGFTLFALIIFNIAKKVFATATKVKAKENIIFFSFLFGLLALLINATYIDVFEASKVAYVFWLMAALFTIDLKYEKN